MTTRVNSLTFYGIDIINVDVQIHISPGIPTFNIVGLADKTIAESKERVRSALHSLGIALPAKRITINLSPADLFKEGSHFDLAIALVILAEMEIINQDQIKDYLILGELALDGKLISISGILPAAIGASAKNLGIICPAANGSEAAWSGNDNIIAADSILSLINHFKNIQIISQPVVKIFDNWENDLEMQDVKGQFVAKRAIEIAACGAHNLIMCGPPGAGKSMLAQRLAAILPPMNTSEMLELSMIKSISQGLLDGKIESKRPFRAPHHSCSMPAMVGGGMGKRIMPGEISLAHRGVLFLDELPEFSRTVLDSLRQPIETGNILISRANSHITYPSKFQLIAAMNPCRCGYLTDPELSCSKAPKCAGDYQSKISGPLLDRIDLHVDLQALTIDEINNCKEKSDTSKVIRQRVINARSIQTERYEGYNITTNSELDGSLLTEFTTASNDAMEILNNAAKTMKLTMRGYNRILRVARTIADMNEAKNINASHILEAVSFRNIYNKKS